MEHLLEFFDRYIRGPSQALVYDDGFRPWSYTHDQLRAAAETVAGRLTRAGLRPGDRVLIWSDSRPEWVATFWGCMLCGAAVVPVDASTSPDLVGRILKAAEPRGVFVGDGLALKPLPSSGFLWRLRDIRWSDSSTPAALRTASDASAGFARPHVDPDTVAEIVFTSGTTGEPKGVVITHRNIVANITPVEREVDALRRYLWLFRPIRFLSLLPLSHMFGQALSIFFPPLVNAATVFTTGYNPDQIIAQARRHQITLMVTVPRMLEMLRDRIGQRAPRCAMPDAAEHPLLVRLWRYRGAHRLFGWRFCGFVLGGAPLDPALEDFWGRLGYAVIQGYGLTETAPMVAWNHPFRPKHGTVGRPLEGIEVRIAADGEILVKGPTVTSGYLNAPVETQSALEGGWFHTGDLGAFDDSGHLVIRGRKKDVIATPEGLKVFPEDVERVLEATPGVCEAAVIGRHADHAESVHAVLVLQPNADPDAIIRGANATLEPHQRIRNFSVWTQGALPRTEPMRKLKRFEIRHWVEEGRPEHAEERPAANDVERLLSKYVKDRVLKPETTLDELGLTSLDRIELMMALEDRAGVTLSETAVSEARTVDDLRHLTEQAAETGVSAEAAFSFPAWNRWPIVRLIRNVSQRTWILPLAHIFFRLHVEGRDRLRALAGPVVFAANHQSHFDMPVILTALPNRRRRMIAVAMWKEYFDAHFLPEGHTLRERLATSTLYYLVAGFFNAFPLPQTEPGARQTLRYMGDVASTGSSILIFPEGSRTEHGEISRFQPGIGLIASKLHLPVVPVRLEGVERVLHHTWHWPRRGDVRVTFGAPLMLEGEDYVALAQRVQEAVVALQPLPVETPRRAPDAASPIYTPPIWRVAALAVSTATVGLADAWLVAWWVGSVWGVALSAGTIVGLMASIAWAIRHYRPAASMGVLVVAVAMTILLARGSPSAAVLGVVVAFAIFGVWFLAYDVWFTGRANAEFVSPVTTLGGDGRAGRALIVHHQGRGPAQFQARMQRAFAEGLQAQGWQVDLTTASRQAPPDVSRYDLLVFGAQAYNWCPARPVVDYIDRVAGLKGKPVVLIVSGGGMTDRAMRVLRTHVLRSGGMIIDAIEIWTSRSNEERHALSDPEAIMRRAGERLTLVPQRKTA